MKEEPLQLRDRIRRDNIIGDLIDARQRDKLSASEYTDSRRLLHASNWKLDGVIGAPVELVAKIRSVCSSFRAERAEATLVVQPPKVIKKTIPDFSYGCNHPTETEEK